MRVDGIRYAHDAVGIHIAPAFGITNERVQWPAAPERGDQAQIVGSAGERRRIFGPKPAGGGRICVQGQADARAMQ